MNRVKLITSLAAMSLVGMGGCGQKGDAVKADTTASASGAVKAAAEELKSFTVDEVEQKIAASDGKFFVFDANDEEVFKQGHVPSAKWIPFSALTADMLPVDKAATLVFYCANEH